MSETTHRSFDVTVVGAGISGLSVAVAAAAAGAHVAVLERATEDEFGGNTRWTEAYFRMSSEDEVSADFEERLAENAGDHLDPYIVEQIVQPDHLRPSFVRAHGMPDPELIAELANRAPETVKWLKTFGVRFDLLPTYFLTAAAPRLMPVGGGLALIEALRAHALRSGVEIFYETSARSLSRERGGAFHLVGAGRHGDVVFGSAAVVLCSGGFEGNPEMLARYLGGVARYVRPVARGGYQNRGEGIRMALELGAATAGDFSSYHAEPLDPRSKRPEALVMNFPYGILVNRHADRFVDEAPGPVDVHYDPISRAIGSQPGGIAWSVFDASIADVPNWMRSIRTDQPPVQADSIEALADKLGLPRKRLAETIAAYNAACPNGTFSPLKVDGLAAVDVFPRKSNWARPIATAPFYAYPIISGICFTYGGVKTNRRAEVIDADGRAIAGLYAAGEVAGLYYQTYTGATSVMRGAVFGKIAGEQAAALARAEAAAQIRTGG
ncbi:FAD-dependent tricarballylate dehydrogenase TcuA [Burkholderia gladioli]|uniref:Putative aspartate oxidase n=1 Tax=Burkholderia gladioli (strain BSR3) TaxID=999541 RepID=F2LI80_BURGS|nr:FAD-dependent tricarballylate dehydrogenase TcuA [Burkholderia gladioli]AEA62746.1 putative aspartate oxidase [Burkholderia gladioli BSR3]